ncbi:MAG: HEPN domain-containing protein [Methanothrix sp.]
MSDIECKGEPAKLSQKWIVWAGNEYAAARLMLLNDELIQGSILSNTAIEKYLKALFVASGMKVPHIHNICKLHDKLKAEGLALDINEEYLALLYKSYLLRYPDDLKVGFNIYLSRTKLLAELDRTVYEIVKNLAFSRDGKTTSGIEDLKARTHSPSFLTKNCSFGGYDSVVLFEEHSPCYELRVETGDNIIEAFLMRNRIRDDRKFDIEALKRLGPGNYQCYLDPSV